MGTCYGKMPIIVIAACQRMKHQHMGASSSCGSGRDVLSSGAGAI